MCKKIIDIQKTIRLKIFEYKRRSKKNEYYICTMNRRKLKNAFKWKRAQTKQSNETQIQSNPINEIVEKRTILWIHVGVKIFGWNFIRF